MQLIYLHGFNSNANSIKGKMLDDWCQAHRPEINVIRPDLNMPPKQVIQLMGDLIAKDAHTGLVGSSLGGYYATVCSSLFDVRAVLVNPAVKPFERFKRFFANGETSFVADTGWVITPDQLDDLGSYFLPAPKYPHNLLVLLKQGDEVLDYREAEQYYGQAESQSPMIVEPGGDHFMHDMETKISLMINFLFDR